MTKSYYQKICHIKFHFRILQGLIIDCEWDNFNRESGVYFRTDNVIQNHQFLSRIEF